MKSSGGDRGKYLRKGEEEKKLEEIWIKDCEGWDGMGTLGRKNRTQKGPSLERTVRATVSGSRQILERYSRFVCHVQREADGMKTR